MAPPAKALVILPKARPAPNKPQAAAPAAGQSTNNIKFGKKPDYKAFAKKKAESKPQKLWWQLDVLVNDTAKPLVSADTPWHAQLEDAPKMEQPAKGALPLVFTIKELQELEPKLQAFYKVEVGLFSSTSNGGMGGDDKWMNSVIASGTWSDKIAALALKVQESPFHNLEALDLLVGIALNKDLRTAGTAVEALKDLFLNNILPDRPLGTLDQLPMKHTDFKPKHALLAWFEKELKRRYRQLLDVVDKALKANLPHFRKQAITNTFDLLNGKPEQEAQLLSMLINKLGDTDGTVMSKASDSLQSLVFKHPAMKAIVVYEARMFIQRCAPKIPPLFAAVVFLNTFKIQEGDDEKAAHLLAESYLALFEVALTAKEKGSRLLSALLKGINRVFPKVTKLGNLAKYVDTIFRLTHTATSQAASTQALILISQMAFRDEDGESSTESTTETDKEGRDRIVNRFYSALYSRVFADQILKQVHNTAFLNLLFRSVKRDPNPSRARAFVKRILMAATQAPAPLAAGLMFIVSEVIAHRPALGQMMETSEMTAADAVNASEGGPSVGDDEEGSVAGSVAECTLFGPFDADKRDPRFSCVGGDKATPVLFELSLLRHHFHPSVRSFASALLEPPAHGIAFSGDPLEEFSTSAFLDRFAYKHPKQHVTERLRAHRRQHDEQPINEELGGADSALDRDAVAPEKHFFFKYFGDRTQLLAAGKMRKRRKGKGEEQDSEAESDADSEELDAFADELAEGLVKSSAHNDGDDGLDFDEDDEGEASDEEDWDEAADAMDLDDFKQSVKGKRNRGQVEDEDDESDGDMPDVYRSDESDDEDADLEGDEDEWDDVEDDGEEEEEEEPELPLKGKKAVAVKAVKGAKELSKKKARMDDFFADAADFEEEMEENVKAHSLEMLEQQLKQEQQAAAVAKPQSLGPKGSKSAPVKGKGNKK